MTQKPDLNYFSGTPEVDGHALASRISSAEEGKSTHLEVSLHWLAPLVLILLNLYCYRHTINGYFLADDFVHIAYLADVFNGHPAKLLENFTGNWMHAWGTQFYRPLISLSLALDFALGHGNALPFHISNTIFHIAASILLYYCSCRLLLPFSRLKRRICALAAATFFTVCPLHTEVVSWVIGRVDGLCLVFFLGAFYLFLRYKQDGGRHWQSASVFCFVLSLCSKEMAVTLPPLLMLSSLRLSQANGWAAKLKEALADSLFYWVTFGAYLAVRCAALGTLSGGYDGSVGEGLANSPMAERFKSASKILFPFNSELISPYDRLVKNLNTIYRIGGVFFAVRLALFRLSGAELKLIGFCIAWFLLALAPTYSVFNINDSLMCSRFAYFASVPFCLFLAVVLSPLWPEQNSPKKKKASKWMHGIAIVLIVALGFVYTGITTKNNRCWADAGKQVREFRAALAATLNKAGAEKKIVLLNVPQRLEGAHMIYNGAMLSVLLSDPLTRPSIADRVLNFEPPTYGDAELINVARLRSLIKDKPDYLYRYWDLGGARLLDLQLDARPCQLNFDLASLNDAINKSKDGIAADINIDSPPLQLNAASSDFVICTLTLPQLVVVGSKPYISLYWSSKHFPEFSAARCINLPALYDGKEHSYVFPVSERKSWLASETIQQLRLQVPHLPGAAPQTGKPSLGAPASSRLQPSAQPRSCGISLGSIKVISGENLIPELRANSMAEGVDGIHRISEPNFELYCDASKIPGCQSITLELSKPNAWFEHYSGTLREDKLSTRSLQSFSKPGQIASFAFSRKDFPAPAYYELRAFALDKSGAPIGFCSDPINLQID